MLERQEKRGRGDDEEGGTEAPWGEGCAWHIPHTISAPRKTTFQLGAKENSKKVAPSRKVDFCSK